MKKTIIALTALTLWLAACGPKEKPSTAPVHPQQPSIVATTADEMGDLIAAMTSSNDMKEILSSDLYSLEDEAKHLYMGNANGESFDPWNWSCLTKASSSEYTNLVGDIHISDDSVTVDMTCAKGSQNKAYTLVMKHENGHWCVDDIVWKGQEAPLDTERHRASAYIDDAITDLTEGDATNIIETRLNALMPDDEVPSNPIETNRQAIEYSIKCLETADHYLKRNRSYTPALEQRLQAAIQKLKKETN